MASHEQASQVWSNGNQSDGEVDEEMSIVIHRSTNTPTLPITLPNWLTECFEEPVEDKEPVCKIQRVPPLLRELHNNKDIYEPLMISLGPFHRGKPNLQYMEKLKISMMRRFIKGTEKSLEVVYDKFLEVASNEKIEYFVLEPEEDLDNDEFLRVLFVDVCFLIQFILAEVRGDEYKHTEMERHEIAFVQRDLFLLENQLPFPIVKALMMLKFTKDEVLGMINNFIRNAFTVQRKQAPWHRRMKQLLQGTSEETHDENVRPHANADDGPEPMHLLHALQMQLLDAKNLKSEGGKGHIWYSYRSVKELRDAGIHFRPLSRFSRLTDMRFDSNLIYGVLSIRPWLIDDQTKARFLNLCAFEALPNAPGNLGVTSYICFIDSLIDSADDVKELRSRGIVFNFLGSDQHVADMFNEITFRLVPNVEAFAQVKSDIERHYSDLGKAWLAQFIDDQFSTPWTVIGLLFALFAIALSVIDTFHLYKKGG